MKLFNKLKLIGKGLQIYLKGCVAIAPERMDGGLNKAGRPALFQGDFNPGAMPRATNI
jgi:hypothetical protein